MRVCVCLRQVPDPQARLELLLGEAGGEELPWVVGEADECALEEAVRLASAREGSDVCALSAGPPRATETLRRALALGAHRAQLLPLESPLAPRELARKLAVVVRRGKADLVVTGAQSTDLGWGLTGTLLAAELGWPHVWLATRAEHDLDPRDGAPSLVVTRELEGRRHERSRLRLPAVLCVQSGIHRPRMPRIRDVLAAKRKSVEVLSDLADPVGDLADASGARAPVVELLGFARPGSTGSAELLGGTPAQAARELIRRLRRDGVLPERA